MSLAADRYARAIFELAEEQKSLEAVENTMTEIKKVISASDDFRMFLINPLLSYEERCAVLKAIFDGKVPDLFYRFLVFITFKNRLNILKEIVQSFDSLYLVHTNRLRAYVKTAMPLSEQDQAYINEQLQKKFKHQMLVRWTLDPSLIGGFRIFVQGKLYDYSFKDQLSHFLQLTTQPIP